MKLKKSKSIIVGELIGIVISPIAMYYCTSRVTHALLSKSIANDIFIILNLGITVLFFNINTICTQLIKIRKMLEKD